MGIKTAREKTYILCKGKLGQGHTWSKNNTFWNNDKYTHEQFVLPFGSPNQEK